MLRRVADTLKALSKAYIFLRVKIKTRYAYQDSNIVFLWLALIENFYFHWRVLLL